MREGRSLGPKTLIRLTLASLILSLAACSGDKPSPAPDKGSGRTNQVAAAPIADGKLVLAFGDSLYAGYQLGATEGLAPALERALAAQGIAATVHNAGVSGDTTAAGLARLAFTLDGLPKKPDLALVGLGGNDMLRGLSPDQTRSNLDAILSELQKRGIPVVLTGMLATRNMGPDYVKAFDPIYPVLAKKHGATLYPFMLEGIAGNPKLLLGDGIHPNPAGVEVIVSKLGPVVGAVLGEK
jgi:acyl-CoA thioesterase I